MNLMLEEYHHTVNVPSAIKMTCETFKKTSVWLVYKTLLIARAAPNIDYFKLCVYS